MIVDANMHWLPEDLFTNIELRDAFLACVPKDEGELAYVAPMPGTDLEQIVIAKPEGHENLNYAENQYDPALRIADMDGAGVDLAVLRIPVWQSWLPLELCKQVNDKLAAHVAAYPDRVRALAVAPPDGTPECLAEVERALALPGFVGVQMAAHYGSDYLDHPRFRATSRRSTPSASRWSCTTRRCRSTGRASSPTPTCAGSTGAASTRARPSAASSSATSSRSAPTCGSSTPCSAAASSPTPTCWRRAARSPTRSSSGSTPAAGVRDRLETNLYFDTSGAAQWGKDQLECAVKVFGADHILYGSSYPVRREWFAQGIDFVKALDIPQERRTSSSPATHSGCSTSGTDMPDDDRPPGLAGPYLRKRRQVVSHQLGIPKAALDSLIQLVDYDAQVKPGMEVLIGAHLDGAYGSENLVDPVVVSWVQAMVASRGANCSVLWIDETMKKHEWRVPPILKGAITDADLFINFSRSGDRGERGVPAVHRKDRDLVRAHVPRHHVPADDRLGADAA